MHLQGVLGLCGRPLSPKRVDKTLPGDRSVRLEQERHEHFALIAGGDRNGFRPAPDLERAEDQVLEPRFDFPASLDRP